MQRVLSMSKKKAKKIIVRDWSNEMTRA